MQSRFPSRIILIAAATPLTVVITHSQPSPYRLSQAQRQTASSALPNASVPVCYIQLENGQIRDLRQLCGKKPLSPTPTSIVPRSRVQPDDDDDESTPSIVSSPVPLQRPINSPPTPSPPTPPPNTPTPQPSAGALMGIPGRSTNGQASPTVPSNKSPELPNPQASPNPSSSPNPLAIPDDEDRY